MNSTERHEVRYQRRKAKREAKRRAKIEKYDDFDRVTNVSALVRAHWDARKGVMWKASVARYDAHYLKNSIRLHRQLEEGRDICTGFYAFGIYERGKRRNIHSLHYAERVVRRSACINSLVPVLSSNLIYDNGASLKDKGVSFALDRCEADLHRFFRATGGNDGYVILIDFKGFFDNIQHGPLLSIIDRFFLDPRLNRLYHQFVESADREKLVEQQGKGLFIGPEDSQIYAVAYPNSIDHTIKDQWRQRFYGRYMDDSRLYVRTLEEAHHILDLLYVEYEKLGIIPNHKKTQIVKISRGFTFLKTKFFLTDTGRVIRKPDHDNIVRERRKLKKFRKFMSAGEMTLDEVCCSYMSWRGYILQKDAYRTVCSMDALFYALFGVKPWKKQRKLSEKEKYEIWLMEQWYRQYRNRTPALTKSPQRSMLLNPC